MSVLIHRTKKKKLRALYSNQREDRGAMAIISLSALGKKVSHNLLTLTSNTKLSLEKSES